MIRPIYIVLVEDSDADAKLVIQELRRAAIAVEVERVHDAETLYEVLATKRCDAVLCDWSLPKLDALQHQFPMLYRTEWHD